ncbi:MAG: CinA family protein [Microbacterium sp.]|uniref:CinA family protein n=1 Tax=Microbacterium sp. TaxID=51671 RepID=UPI0039E4E75C
MSGFDEEPLEAATTIVRRGRRTEAERVVDRLRELDWTIAVAESLTGGLLVASLVDVPGASACVRGGIVAYDSALKHSLLGVDAGFLADHGAVQPKVARQMADGVREAAAVAGVPAHVGVSTTGIAGPDSPDGQAVGTVHIGVSTPLGTRVETLALSGSREQIRAQAVRRALRLVLDAL